VAAREISGSLRQHLLVSDGEALEKYRAKGVEIHRLDPADVNASRPTAIEAWKAATKNDPLAVKILDSQIAFMKRLGLLT
jgi:TRAP-type mannitol/chloroaromatic compound transport system substrate-binding protein